HVSNDAIVAENLERLGNIAKTRDHEQEIGDAFMKFSHVTKDLSSMMKNMMDGLNNMVLFPLDSFMKGEFKGAKGDLKKPFDKAWKDYEAKFTKTEKEKKKQAQDAGMIRGEISGAELAEEMEKERKIFQLQMCEYLIKVNEIRTKKGSDLLQSLAEYYQVQANFFKDGLRTIQHFHDFVEELLKQLQKIRQRHDAEKRQLVDLRDALKSSMKAYKEPPPVSSSPAGYNLHQPSGDKSLGCEKKGHLLKKSEGRVRKMWLKRKCIIRDGHMEISHHDESKDPVKLCLLTCQVKLVPDDPGKKCFDVISSSDNRTYHFQADDTKDMEEWISVLNNAKEGIFMNFLKNNTNSPSLNQSVRELTASIMDRIRRLPGNKECCDCGAAGKMVSYVSLSQNVLSSEKDVLEWMHAETGKRLESGDVKKYNDQKECQGKISQLGKWKSTFRFWHIMIGKKVKFASMVILLVYINGINKDADRMIKIEEDRIFLTDQRGPRLMKMAGIDKNLTRQEERSRQRKEAEYERRKREQTRKAGEASVSTWQESGSEKKVPVSEKRSIVRAMSQAGDDWSDRAIKLEDCTDLAVVEDNRKRIPDSQKSTLTSYKTRGSADSAGSSTRT
ncbi:Arf-GAP with SH3 domain, ANK repeat and PH domain-containing protein 1, partial [Bulinus truncatus]